MIYMQASEYALTFLVQCRDEDISPKFTRWKNLRKLSVGEKKETMQANPFLKESTINTSKLIKQLKKSKLKKTLIIYNLVKARCCEIHHEQLS